MSEWKSLIGKVYAADKPPKGFKPLKEICTELGRSEDYTRKILNKCIADGLVESVSVKVVKNSGYHGKVIYYRQVPKSKVKAPKSK